MNVYVESNFVLEQALEQEQCESCERLIGLATTGTIRLIIPAFSLAEPHISLMRKGNERSRLSAELQKHISELKRSRFYSEAATNFSESIEVLVKSAEREYEGLYRAIETILSVAEVIPLDSEILYQGRGIQVGLDMSAQDSIVLASVVKHLIETKPARCCFLNRNSKDFDDPNVRQVLDESGCKFFDRFDNGLRYIESVVRKSDP